VTEDNVEELISRLGKLLDILEVVLADSFGDYLERHTSNFANVGSSIINHIMKTSIIN